MAQLEFSETLNYPLILVPPTQKTTTLRRTLSFPSLYGWETVQYGDDVGNPIDSHRGDLGDDRAIGWLDFFRPKQKMDNAEANQLVRTGLPRTSKLTFNVWLKRIPDIFYNDESATVVSINAPGTGYAVGDVLTLKQPIVGGVFSLFPAEVAVTSVGPGGAITDIDLVQGGYGLTTGSKVTFGGTGVGATVTVDTTGEFYKADYQWAVSLGDTRYELNFDSFTESGGHVFATREIILQDYLDDVSPKLGLFVDLSGEGNRRTAPDLKQFLFTPQWYLAIARFSEIFMNYKVVYNIPQVDDGDVQDVPINMASITKMLNTRDRRRDKKKGRDVTPVRELLRRASGDLRRRREINRPLTNAF